MSIFLISQLWRFPRLKAISKRWTMRRLTVTVRLYAAWELPSVRTPWDDDFYRAGARATALEQSGLTTARKLMLPHGGLLIDGRLNGYNDWLAAAVELRRALWIGSNEVALQTANALMLLLEAVAVLLFARWAFGDRALGWAFTFLYVAVPVVFGTSRWVHTENLVLLAGVALSGLSAWLLGHAPTHGPHPRLAQAARVVSAAWGIGLCTRAREYVAPTFVVLLLCTEGVLVLRRRWLEAGLSTAVIGAFLVPWVPPVIEAVRTTLGKGEQMNYFHPLAEWIPHVFFYTVGPSFTVLLLGLGAAVVVELSRAVWRRFPPSLGAARRFLRIELSGVRPLLWCHGFLLFLYAATFVWSRNRVTRPAIPMMLAALGIVLLGVRAFPSLRGWLRRAPAKLIGLGLVAVAWSVLAYQLLFAFDGGKTYAHHGSRLEYFNYPLRIRPLTGPEDDHTCLDICPYDKR